jgi:hypothetical protein
MYNFFKKYPIHHCCQKNAIRPFYEYVYFMNGFIMATNGFSLVLISYKDLKLEIEVQYLDGFKIHYCDADILTHAEYMNVGLHGKIYFGGMFQHCMQLYPIDYDDSNDEVNKIFDIYQDLLKKMETPMLTNSIKFGLKSLNDVCQAFDEHIPSLLFLKNPDRVIIKFENYPDSMGVIMPLKI